MATYYRPRKCGSCERMFVPGKIQGAPADTCGPCGGRGDRLPARSALRPYDVADALLDCAITAEGWARANGYDPVTRTYSLTGNSQ